MSFCSSDEELEEAIKEHEDDLEGLILWALSAMSYECDSLELHTVESHSEQRRKWSARLFEHLKEKGWGATTSQTIWKVDYSCDEYPSKWGLAIIGGGTEAAFGESEEEARADFNKSMKKETNSRVKNYTITSIKRK